MTATLSELLRNAVAHHASRTAVEDPVMGAVITYEALGSRARTVREALARHGVRRGDRVGICAPKTIGTVVTIFGILDAGAAYVPVDAGAPPMRSAGIFEDCAIRLAVVDESLVDGLREVWPWQPLEVLEEFDGGLVLVRGASIEPDGATRTTAETDVAKHGAELSPEDVAYILYTSGSTGKPKGVVHTHRSALGFIDWCSDTFTPTDADRFSSHAPFHFDLSILDIYVPLKHGATLVLIGEEAGKQPAGLAPLIASARITVWYSTPSILRLLVEYGKLEQLDWSALRLVLFAGEVFPVKHLRALKQRWPAPRYYNLFGPTETNVCTYYEIPEGIADDRTDPYPIGFVCSGDVAMVVDEDNNEMPPGAEGELLITGVTVMRGYWNHPARTAQSFFTDGAGRSWYRTGDLARLSENDGYIFLGRRDRMVKRRGYRVELGEIEAALYRHPLVAEAAVTSSPDEANGVLVKAFLSLSGETRPTLVEMKRFCMEQLPGYMIPDRFLFPGPLPKTSTDKIDYQRLKQLE